MVQARCPPGTCPKGQSEQFEEAIPILERAASVSHRSSAVLGVLVHAYAGAGRRAEALRVLDELHRRRKAGYVPTAAFLKVHPFFDPLRGDPRFAAFVRRANLQ